MQRLKIGVLMGGRSVECEVSFNSGRTICDHLDTNLYEVIPLFQTKNGIIYRIPWYFLHRGKTTDFIHRLETESEVITWDTLPAVVDFVYIALHGRYGEDGTLQAMLELLCIPYLGSDVLTSALCRDKSVLRSYLKSINVNVPAGFTLFPNQLKDKETITNVVQQYMADHGVTYPCIVKPHGEGSSLGIVIAHSLMELIQGISFAASVTDGIMQSVIVEECICGMEFTSIILEDGLGNYQALPPTEIETESGTMFFDYEQKYMPGRAHKYTPARCSVEIQDAIKNITTYVMQALNVKTIARIDGFVGADGTISIIDVNTISGMGPASFVFRAAAQVGMSHADLINYLITADLKRRNMISSDLEVSTVYNKNSQSVKLRVGVLFGGASNEREISLESGRNVIYKLSNHNYTVLPLFLTREEKIYSIEHSLLVKSSTQEITEALEESRNIPWSQLPNVVDFVFIALHGGNGENGIVQGVLETLGLPYNGSSVFASSLCMDKYKTTQFLAKNGFDIPGELLVSAADWQRDNSAVIDAVSSEIGYPCIVKPHDDGCSVLVHKVYNADALIGAIEAVFARHKTFALVQEFVVGMELTVGVVGNYNDVCALPPSQAVVSGDILTIEEKFLPGAGENQTPAPLSASALQFVKNTVAQVYQAVNCAGYARIDCFYQSADKSKTGKERVIILEINTLPGLTPATCLFHQAAEIGLKPMDLIDRIVKLGLEYHQCSRQLNTLLRSDIVNDRGA